MEFKIDATLYLQATEEDTIPDLIDRLYEMIDPIIGMQVYVDTAEIRSV